MAADELLWRTHALARWPGADAAELGYGDDWRRLYAARALMPHAFPLAADRVRAISAAQRSRQAAAGAGGSAAGAAKGGGGLPQLALEEVMRQVHAIALACGRCEAGAALGLVGAACGSLRAVAARSKAHTAATAPHCCSNRVQLRRTAEWRRLKADLAWWAAERAPVLVAFLRAAHEGAQAEAPWRRSAAAALLDLGLLAGAHASVADRFAAEVAALDGAIRVGALG